jgi:DNA-binding transcriptional MerR regulator
MSCCRPRASIACNPVYFELTNRHTMSRAQRPLPTPPSVPHTALADSNPREGEPARSEWTVEALSEQTGVSVRNIRAYQTAGLLPPPRLRGRLGLYDDQHVAKLTLVRDLRQQGFKLDTIKGLLDQAPDGAWGEYALMGQLFSRTFFTVERPQRKAIKDMAAHWGTTATEAERERLSTSGLYRALDADHVEMLSPALERIGEQLAELQVPLNLVLDLQDTLVTHMRAIAQAYLEHLFLTAVPKLAQQHSDGAQGAGAQAAADAVNSMASAATLSTSAATLLQLFERLRPLAIGSVSAAFPVILQQEFERAVAQRKG